MNTLLVVVLALIGAVYVNSQQCAQQMEQSMQCIQSVMNNDPLQSRKDQIYQQCLGTNAAQCAQQQQALRSCFMQAQNDPNVQTLKRQMQTAVDSCFSQFPSSNTGLFNPRFRDNGNDDDDDDDNDDDNSPRNKRHAGGQARLPACQGNTAEQQNCVRNAMQQLTSDPNAQAQKQQFRQQKQACMNQLSSQCRPGRNDANLCNCLCNAKQAYKQAKQNAVQMCAQQQGINIPASGRQMACGNGCRGGFGQQG